MNRLRHLVIAFTLIISTLVLACKQEEPIPAVDLVTVRKGYVVYLSDGTKLSSDTVAVVPCPPNAYCYAPDLVSVHFRLARGTQSKSFRLSAPGYNYKRIKGISHDSAGVVLEGWTYKVILREGRYGTGPSAAYMDEAVIEVTRL